MSIAPVLIEYSAVDKKLSPKFVQKVGKSVILW